MGFVAGILLVYYLLPRRLQNIWLLLASYLFYVMIAWQFAVVLLFVTLINYGLGHLIRKSDGRQWLWLGILLNVLALGYFKYASFFVPQFIAWIRWAGITIQNDTGLQILLPIGLSFVILQAIAYLVDVRQKRLKTPANLVDFSLYIAYFPKLTSGPIEKAGTFLSKLATDRVVDNAALRRSVGLIIIGLVRKLLIADTLTRIVPADAFMDPSQFTSPGLIAYLLGYSFALYNDFAGYTSIVRGISGLFGIELARNFQQPYFSRSFNEFWNRWHISLSHWLRDYIFFPLSRALRKRLSSPQHVVNLILPPLVTMLISGLWHGVNWGMIVWGGLHGIYQVIWQILFRRGLIEPPEKQPVWKQAISTGVVFVFVVLAWLSFRMPLPIAGAYLKNLLTWGGLSNLGIRIYLTIGLSILIDGLQYRARDEFFFQTWPRLVQASLLALIWLALFLVLYTERSPLFVYQGF